MMDFTKIFENKKNHGVIVDAKTDECGNLLISYNRIFVFLICLSTGEVQFANLSPKDIEVLASDGVNIDYDEGCILNYAAGHFGWE